MATTTPFIAATIPAKVARYSGTTLFHVAMLEEGDPLQWAAIAQLNHMVDPWVNALTDVEIPPVFPSFAAGQESGLLLVLPGGATEAPLNPASDFNLSFFDLQDFRNLIGL